MIPLRLSGNFDPSTSNTSVGGKGGINILLAPELSSPNFVQENTGYKIEEDGALTKLQGIDETFTVAGGNAGTMLEEWESDIWVYGYSNIVAAYDKTNDVSTIIKNDFTTSDSFVGVPNGAYFFTCNGGDKIGRISRTIDYKTQTANFTIGLLITGGTSGATAIVLEDSDAGTTGTLTLSEINGVFVDGEALTDSSTGAAVVDGILDFTYTEITDAPKAKVLELFGTRLYAGNLSGDIVGSKQGTQETVVWAKQDTGENPPMVVWTTSDTPPKPTDPASLRFRNAGQVNSFTSLGQQLVSFHDRGKTGFVLGELDVTASGLAQTTKVDFQKLDFGAFSSVETPVGILYTNESGLWGMTSGGNTSQPFSSNDEPLSKNFLTEDVLADIDFSDSDMVYIDQLEWVLVTCKNNASFNNFVFWYHVKNGSFGVIPDWEISRFMKIEDELYGMSSLTTTVYKLFDGYEVNDTATTTAYKQEIQLAGGLDDLYSLVDFTVKGELHPESSINISFDVYDEYETLLPNFKMFTWTTGGGIKEVEGFNDAGFNAAGFNGSSAGNSLVETRGRKRTKIFNIKRLIVKFSSEDRYAHKLTYFIVNVRGRGKNMITQNIN